MNYAHLNDVYEDYLEHYGVKGMEWGKSKKKRNTLSAQEEFREKMSPYNKNKIGYMVPYVYETSRNRTEVTYTKDGYEVRNVTTDKNGKTSARITRVRDDGTGSKPKELAGLSKDEYDTLTKRRSRYVKRAKTNTAAMNLGIKLSKSSDKISKGYAAITKYLGVDLSKPRKR